MEVRFRQISSNLSSSRQLAKIPRSPLSTAAPTHRAPAALLQHGSSQHRSRAGGATRAAGDDTPPVAKKHGPAWRPPAVTPPKPRAPVPPAYPDTFAASPPVTASPVSSSKQAPEETPVQQKVLNGILSISNVPYSSFVPTPTTPLHKVDARIKQLWLVAIYLLIARATPTVRVAVCATIAVVSALCLPPRLCRSQLTRLGLLCGVIFIFTALFSGSVPTVLQPRGLPAGLADLPPPPATGYNFVVLHLLFITVTHRSINLAITVACLTFASLQAASLCLVTTPGEEMALALRWWLAPLRLFKAPVRELSLTLLLSLRFMSLVFEEVRNLCLGLAARGVDWRAQGFGGSLQLYARLFTRLFGNLAQRSDNIATAMVARGFVGPDEHQTYMMQVNETSWLANACALFVLAAFSTSIYLL